MQYFANPDNCVSYLVARRWPNGVVCPTCGSKKVSYVPSRRVWQCKTRHPKCQFSIKVGTIFEDSPIALDKWLAAMWMLANCKNGVSSWEIHRAVGVTQKSAWFMLQRIRLALQGKSTVKLGGAGSEVEVDETFIGGKARNMHADAHGVGRSPQLAQGQDCGHRHSGTWRQRSARLSFQIADEERFKARSQARRTWPAVYTDALHVLHGTE